MSAGTVASPAASRPCDLRRRARGPALVDRSRTCRQRSSSGLFNRRSRASPGGATPREARDSNGGARGGNRVPPTFLVLDQREHVVPFQAFPAFEKRQLEQARQADYLAAELLDEVDRRLRGAPGREHVVVNEHSLTQLDRVGVDLELVEAVLERVLGRNGTPRQLAGLAGSHEATAEPARERPAGDVAARFRPENEIRSPRFGPLSEQVDRLP